MSDKPIWPLPGRWPESTQAGRTLRITWEAAAAWIAIALDALHEDVVLQEVLILRSWSISAWIECRGSKFLFKANCLGIYDDAPEIYRALTRLVPHTTPELIADRCDASGLWMLFHYAPGRDVKDVGKRAILGDMAKLIARIQTARAEARWDRRFAILDLRVGGSVGALRTLIDRIDDQYLPQAAPDIEIP